MLTQQAVCFDNMNYLVEEAVQFDVLIDGRSDDEGVALGRAYFQARGGLGGPRQEHQPIGPR